MGFSMSSFGREIGDGFSAMLGWPSSQEQLAISTIPSCLVWINSHVFVDKRIFGIPA